MPFNTHSLCFPNSRIMNCRSAYNIHVCGNISTTHLNPSKTFYRICYVYQIVIPSNINCHLEAISFSSSRPIGAALSYLYPLQHKGQTTTMTPSAPGHHKPTHMVTRHAYRCTFMTPHCFRFRQERQYFWTDLSKYHSTTDASDCILISSKPTSYPYAWNLPSKSPD